MGVEQIELWRIREPRNPLRTEVMGDGFEELVESVRVHGLLNPLTVRARGEGYEVVAGHRRLLACRRLGLETVPVFVVVVGEGDEEIVGAHENLIRRDMSIGDEARLVAALMGREGWGIGSCGRALNRSEGWVRDRVDLLGWPAAVVVAVSEGKLALGAARALMGVEDDRDRDELLRHAVAGGCSIAAAKRWAADANLGRWSTGQGVVALSKDAGVPGPVMARLACFLCEEVSVAGELVYIWCHRECVVALERSLAEARVASVGVPVQGGPGD